MFWHKNSVFYSHRTLVDTFYVTFTTDSNCFTKLHYLAAVCNRDAVCVLWQGKRIFMHCEINQIIEGLIFVSRAQNIVKEIKQYQEKWLQHVQRMDTNRLPKQALQYKPKGRSNIGRPRKRWRNQLHLKDQGKGNMPNPSGTWWWWNLKPTGNFTYHQV